VTEASNNRLGRFDLPSLALSKTMQVGVDPSDVAFSPDGLTAYVTNIGSRTLGVVDVATNTQTQAILMPGPPYRVAVSADGSRVYVTTSNGFLATVIVETSFVSYFDVGGTLNGIAIHPTQPLVYVSSTGGTVTELSRTTGLATRSFTIAGSAQELAVSADGAQLYVANEGGALEVRSTTTLGLVTSVLAASNAFGMKLTPDNTQLYVTQSAAGNVLVLDRATMAVVRTFAGGSPRRIAFDRNGTTAVIANETGWVTFIK
jgi:YVTN family beta-propeller protein